MAIRSHYEELTSEVRQDLEAMCPEGALALGWDACHCPLVLTHSSEPAEGIDVIRDDDWPDAVAPVIGYRL